MPEQYIDRRRPAPARALFPAGVQQRLLETARQRLGRGSRQRLAQLCGIHSRTLIDWRREKYTISLAALAELREHWPDLPAPAVVVDPFRHVREAGRLGALSRYKRYGNPGTAAGRQKGGQATQRLFRRNPEQAKARGFITRRRIRQPRRSERLAELVGVLLGDGHIARWQVMVYLNRTERPMAEYVRALIEELFGLVPALHARRNYLVVTASSRSLVEWLTQAGVCAGDKISGRAKVPAWIFRTPAFMRGCVRGLIDADGSLFSHRHRVNGRSYQHLGIEFTSYAPSLLRSMAELLRALDFEAKTYPRTGHLFIYRWSQVQRYMRQISTRHPHRRLLFQQYCQARRGRVVAERTRLESV